MVTDQETNQSPPCWKISLACTRADADALGADNLFLGSSDSSPSIVARRGDSDSDDDWLIEVYHDEEPDGLMLSTISSLAPGAKSEPHVELLPSEDWVTLSQEGSEPMRIGRFHVHTSYHPPLYRDGIRDLQIEASRAFGTGHHETTSGCLRQLDKLRSNGSVFRNVADIGTGTGLLAFGAKHLWPTARIIASDIDPVAVEVSQHNAEVNGIAEGDAPGQVYFVVSDGLNHRALHRRAPYDLIIANILAGPLISLAPPISAASANGGHLILAGLMKDQQEQVVAAYRRAGFHLINSHCEIEWPTLHFRKIRGQPSRRIGKSRAVSKNYGEW